MSIILDGIKSAADISRLDEDQMEQLAGELRKEIISCVASLGGHLASNLGAVELTLAILAELDPFSDRIVWDVGHQCYAYKILTGRREAMCRLRSEGGPSGFPCILESGADAFGTGHASTSISAALGIAVARRISGASYRVAAVIGDGALTGGLAYEAMNNAGAMKEDLLVILNDNEMAISANTGSIAKFLSRVRFSPARRDLETSIKHLLSAVPVVGDSLRQAGHLAKRSLKGLLLPKMLFEDMGFTYIGPLDGHDVGVLRSAIRDAVKIGGPVLIHAVTKKGKGYSFAEKDPDSFHGTGPFDLSTGRKEASTSSCFTDVFSKKLLSLAQDDMRIVAITAAMPTGTGLKQFAKLYPKRYFDVGIAEGHAITFAAGLAAKGAIPVVALYSTFIQRAFDQMVHDVALQGLHVVICADRAGIVGEDGATHQGAYDIAMCSSLPGFTVLAPMDGAELACMMHWAVKEANGPVLLRYPKAETPMPSDWSDRSFVPGKARHLATGRHLMMISAGSISNEALSAAKLLKRDGIEASVMDVRSIKPIDDEAIRAAASSYSHIITIEEGVPRGGLYSAVCLSAGANCKASIAPIGFPEEPIRHGRRDELLKTLGLDAEGIARTARLIVQGGSIPNGSD